MNCKNCNKQATALDLCETCFTKMIEKRIRKYLRINKFIEKNDKVIAVGNVTYHLLKSIFDKLPLNITQVEVQPKETKGVKIVIPWTLDHENHYFLQNFIDDKPKPFLKSNLIKLLLPITDVEAQLYAKIKKLNYTPMKQDKYTQLFTILEPKYQSVRYAFSTSVSEFKKLK